MGNLVVRADMLAAFGVLAALLCHCKAVRAGGRSKARWLAAIGLAVAIGIFSKESTIAAVAVIALYDITWEREASWRLRLPSYIAASLPILVYLEVRCTLVTRSGISFLHSSWRQPSERGKASNATPTSRRLWREPKS